MSCRMVDNIGTVLVKNHIQATTVTNGPYQRHKIELIAILTDKFLLNGIGIVLVNVKDY